MSIQACRRRMPARRHAAAAAAVRARAGAVARLGATCVAAILVGGVLDRPAAASEQGSGISIGGAQLPNLRPIAPASGLAPGAAGLPDAAAVIDRIPPGAHGVPPAAGAPPAASPAAPAAPPQAAAPPPPGWSEAEVRAAQVQCQRALSGLEAQYTFIPQVKSGECGAPAAIELSGFGKGLAIAPPIVVTCDIAAALHTWMKTQVQPLAKRHLGTGIIQINTMSSYACRNRYGAKNAPLSQHAFANAIDIRGFVTAKGQLLDVEQHWGPTSKEMAAHQAAQPTIVASAASALPYASAVTGQGKAARLPGAVPPIVAAAVPSVTGALKPGAPPTGHASPGSAWATTVAAGPAIMPAAVVTADRPLQPGHPVPPAPKPAAIGLKPTFPVIIPATAGEPSAIKIVATGQPAMMGAAPVLPGQPLDGRAHFFRSIWQAACGPFLTVLGPEANRAHRNHLHVDLAQRRSGAYCQ